MSSKRKFELVIVGGVPFRYRRWHSTVEAAEKTAYEVMSRIAGNIRAAHPAIVYGPGLADDGMTFQL